jgi:hypothetical protein
LGGTAYGLYYGIFLYRHSTDLRILAIDSLLVALATWIGYFAGTFAIRRSGYALTIRTTFVLSAAVALVTLLIMNRVQTFYPALALGRGIPAGMFTAVIDIFLLQELSAAKRGQYLSINLSAEFIVTVFLPFLIGGLIKLTHGYESVFLLAAVIYAVGIFLPIHKQRRPQTELHIRDELAVLKKPGVKEFNINNALTSGADQLNGLLLAIVPFLLFKSELSVGSFTSFIALFAAIVSLLTQRTKLGHQVRLGYLGNVGRLLSNVMLCISWTPWALMIQGMVNKAMSPLNDPIFQKIRIENASAILGKELADKALALNMVTATVSFLGRAVALLVFLLVLSLNHAGQVSILRYLLITYAGWKILNYAWVISMQRRLGRAR